MITDQVISGLTNFFSLFTSRGDIDQKVTSVMLKAFYTRHCGVRSPEVYLGIYQDYLDIYSMQQPDIEATVKGICQGMKKELNNEECAMFLLRLMEFCAKTPETFDENDPIFIHIAKNFGVDEKLCHVFADFVLDHETEHVKITQFNGFEAPVKTLWLKRFNLMVFSYAGGDYKKTLFNDVPVVCGTYQAWDTSGILKNKTSGSIVYYSQVQELYETRQEQNQIIYSGRDINFRFPKSDNGMHNFSFDMHNGEMIAIMGGSGSGKTTLVSLLNGNIKPQSGVITINGHSIEEEKAKALIGFVPQDDLLIEELTVYQNLYYTAKLCFEGMTEGEIDARVIKCLRQLGLEQAKDLKVGSPINKFISGGQRKRLNIALELIREPAILFLDEPTSGLSSADTESVVMLLKEQTFHGKLVVMNIHQPSSDVYKLFDRLWILDKGGYPVFDGNPIEAITYFKGIAGYPDPESSMCPTCGNVNPEIVLNIVEEKALDNKGQRTDERKVKPQQWHQYYLENRPELKQHDKTAIPSTAQKKPGVLKQWYLFMKRNVMTKITNIQYLAITLLEAPLLAFVCAMLTHFTPAGQEYSLLENKNLVSYLFMAVIVATFVGMSGSAEEIIKDRALLKREKFLQLSYHSYIWSKIVLMAFVSIIQTLLFVSVGNLVMGVTDNFLVWWGILAMTAILANLTGLVLSQCLSSVVSIYISIPILLIPQILLCGLVVNFSDLTPDSTTGNVPAIGNVIPSRWSYEALAVNSYTSNEYEAPLFRYDKEKYETQYYRLGFIYQLQSANETIEQDRKLGNKQNPGNLTLIKTELPFVTQLCGMKAYGGKYDYNSLHSYLSDAEDIMMQRGNKASLAADHIMQMYVDANGKEELEKLKRNHFNLQLETQLAGQKAKEICEVVDGHIVPRAGFVYLTPRSTNGNAPFYSSEKRVGSWTIPTLWFNMAVMLLMSIIVVICLLNDFPGRFIRK